MNAWKISLWMRIPNRNYVDHFLLCFSAIPHNAWDGVGSSDQDMPIEDILYARY